ncbi:MAG: hypothetical protein OXB95_13295 [Rhodobacteraceae bacterium]|nr:hypothetical protein [Paracoccaceae bacterium]
MAADRLQVWRNGKAWSAVGNSGCAGGFAKAFFLDIRFEQVADSLAPCGKFRVCRARQPASLDAMLDAPKRADEPVCEAERNSNGSPLGMHATKFGCVSVTAIGPTMLESDGHPWQSSRRACFQGDEGGRLGDFPNRARKIMAGGDQDGERKLGVFNRKPSRSNRKALLPATMTGGARATPAVVSL